MGTILEQLADHARERVEEDKRRISLSEMKRLAGEMPQPGRKTFRDAISGPALSVICEVKKASPSKGIIDPVFDYLKTAREYEAAGADAVSCLTEPRWFLGSDAIFREIREAIKTPMLRKDFVVDAYQLYQAKTMGADCILLICSLLDTKTIREYLALCGELGLDALVETHDEEEIGSALDAGAGIIGVNNRNLKDFSVHIEHAAALRKQIPSDRLFVAESGVRGPADAAMLRAAGADAILVGEALMRSKDKAACLRAMREAAK